jgi:hypothetical protein
MWQRACLAFSCPDRNMPAPAPAARTLARGRGPAPARVRSRASAASGGQRLSGLWAGSLHPSTVRPRRAELSLRVSGVVKHALPAARLGKDIFTNTPARSSRHDPNEEPDRGRGILSAPSSSIIQRPTAEPSGLSLQRPPSVWRADSAHRRTHLPRCCSAIAIRGAGPLDHP